MPPVVGRPNLEMSGYEVVGQIAGAVSYLRAHAFGEKVTGLWNDFVAWVRDAFVSDVRLPI